MCVQELPLIHLHSAMSNTTNEADVVLVEVDLSDLNPHPQQDLLFAPPAPEEITRLADDIERNGLRQAIEVLPDGTIIRGHSRVLAAKQAGLTTIQAIIREDLEEAGEAAVLRALAEDNLNRRHLSPLEIAKSFAVIQTSSLKDANGDNLARAMSRLQKQIAQQFGISKKTLQRYIRVLDTPLTVQHAVTKGYLSMDIALQIQSLPPKRQTKIGAAIETLVNAQTTRDDSLPKKVKAEVLRAMGEAHTQRQSASPLAKLIKALQNAQEAFGSDETIKGSQNRRWSVQRASLVAGQQLLTKLIEQHDEAMRSNSKAA